MIPIRDINPRMRIPFVNYGLLAAIIAVFIYQLSLGDAVRGLIESHGFTPATLRAAFREGAGDGMGQGLLSVLSSMFLHGGWFHVIGNLLYLRVFGDNVEDHFGHLGFLFFYLASGIAGALGQYSMEPTSSVPMVGASGAIAGVLGAYVILFPAARIVTLFPVFIFLTFIEVPAFLFLGLWALQQLLNGYLALGDAPGPGVAWFAHLGGFALGVFVGLVHRLGRRRRRRQR